VQYGGAHNPLIDAWCSLLIYRKYFSKFKNIYCGVEDFLSSYSVDDFFDSEGSNKFPLVNDVSDMELLFYSKCVMSRDFVSLNDAKDDKRRQWKRLRQRGDNVQYERRMKIPKFDVTEFLFFKKRNRGTVRVRKTDIECKYHKGQYCMVLYTFFEVVEPIYRCSKQFSSHDIMLASVFAECVARYRVDNCKVMRLRSINLNNYFEFYKQYFGVHAAVSEGDSFRVDVVPISTSFDVMLVQEWYGFMSGLCRKYHVVLFSIMGRGNNKYYITLKGFVSSIQDVVRNALLQGYDIDVV